MRCLQDSGRICPAHALGQAASPPRMHFITSPLANNPHSASHTAAARGVRREGPATAALLSRGLLPLADA